MVLLVDTCEELAKTSPDGRVPRNVVETFRILRALHDGPATLRNDDSPPSGGVPDLRVIFAGPGRSRVPARGAGHNAAGRRISAPPRFSGASRDSRLHVPRSRGILDNADPRACGLDSDHREGSSPEAGGGAAIEWEKPENGPAQVPRCNPYELKLYADWAKEDPPPTKEDLERRRPANSSS